MNFESIIALEKKLLKNSVRKNETELKVLLNDDFIEFGVSGHIYTKQIVIQRLRDEDPVDAEAFDFEGTHLKCIAGYLKNVIN